MAVRLSKAWQELDAMNVEKTAAQLGVYELADKEGRVVYIGSAGARSLFGLRGELMDRIGTAARFRCEVNTAYRTRHRELLMAHFRDCGCYPELNSDIETRNLGRLS